MLKTELAASVNYRERIIVKNITSNTDAILTGYKILVSENPNDYNFLNTRIDFNSEVTILAGFKNSIEIVCFPSKKFDLLLYTNRNTSDKITVNVNTYDKLSCAQYYSYLNPPTINVTELTTSDTTPDLNGVISDTSATLSLILDGTTYTPNNDGDSTWSLTDVNELEVGTYDVNICATDIYGTMTCSLSEDVLIIESDLEVSITSLHGNYGYGGISINFSGNISSPLATITIATNLVPTFNEGEILDGTNDGDGTWSYQVWSPFGSGYSPPDMVEGAYTYDVNVCATLNENTVCVQDQFDFGFSF